MRSESEHSSISTHLLLISNFERQHFQNRALYYEQEYRVDHLNTKQMVLFDSLFLSRLRYKSRHCCLLLNIAPDRGLPTAFQARSDSTEACLRTVSSSFHQNLCSIIVFRHKATFCITHDKNDTII